ncbi:MAG: NAD-dependent epimerase/dehydratase family protein [Gammaproteobacteria bacterium]|nr:NAD-dependent epimerase/dehydratase family protein [Gammaproteobacteria bacterium]
MRILLTGAGGFIGRQAVPFLLARGHALRVLARRPEAVPAAWAEAGVEVVAGDLAAPQSLKAACAGREAVWHLAGLAHVRGAAAEAHERINRDGSLALGRAAASAGVSRFVFLSTAKAMGDSDSCQDESSTLAPDTPYGRTKRAAEDGILAQDGLPAVVLRPPLVYGPGVAGNLGLMLDLALRGRLPPLPRLANRRSLIGTADLLQSLWAATVRDQAVGRRLLVTDGEVYSTSRIETALRRVAGSGEPVLRPPAALCAGAAALGTLLGRALGRPLPFDRQAWKVLSGNAEYDNALARECLDWRPADTLESLLPAMVDGARREGL